MSFGRTVRMHSLSRTCYTRRNRTRRGRRLLRLLSICAALTKRTNSFFPVGLLRLLPASKNSSTSELLLLAKLGEKVLDRTDPNTPKRFNVSLYTGAGFHPMKGDLPDISITETSEDPEKGVHIWGLGKKGWNQFDT